MWCRQIQTQVFLTPKPALLSTAPTAHQIERGRESAKGRKGNLDKDIEGTLNMPRGEGLCRGRRRSKAGQERAANPALRPKGARVVSDLGKTMFLEDSPGSGVRCGLTREIVKWGGHFCSSSGTRGNRESGDKCWVPEARAGGRGQVRGVRASPPCGGVREVGLWSSWGGSRSLAFSGIIRWPRRHAQELAGHDGWQFAGKGGWSWSKRESPGPQTQSQEGGTFGLEREKKWQKWRSYQTNRKQRGSALRALVSIKQTVFNLSSCHLHTQLYPQKSS